MSKAGEAKSLDVIERAPEWLQSSNTPVPREKCVQIDELDTLPLVDSDLNRSLWSLRRRATLLAALLPVVVAGCNRSGPAFPALAQEVVSRSLAFAPNAATQSGLHRYVDPASGDTLRLDAILDDYSTTSLDRQRAYYEGVRQRLAAIPRDRLDPQTAADYDLLQNAVSFSLFALNQERFFERRPQLYAEVLGNALFGNMSLEYADTAARAAHLASRLQQVPAFVTSALANLKASNAVYRNVALEEMSGVAEMIRGMGASFVKGTPSESTYATAQPAALAALDSYKAFVRDSLPKLAAFDWRMGREMFETKWRYYLQSSITPDEMLRSAEDSMRTIRTQMLSLAQPLHDQWFPGHRHIANDSTVYLNSVVGEVLARIGQEHTNRDSLVVQAKKEVEALAAFVGEHRVLSLTDFSNVKVIPTPVFMRGIYGVAGAVFAPALEPKLSSFYWVTPIPAEWPAARAESKLREYNAYKFLSLTIHEALPGHLVQGEYANRVIPEWRRLVRAVFGNGAYIEGWAVYAEHMMEQLGMNGGDSVKARLTALKGMLRVYSNVIIDARLQMLEMPTDSVVPFLTRSAFQEEPEATAKLQRAQLDYVQLNLYPVGLHEWWSLRREAERVEGTAFNLCHFHDIVLSYGPVPVPVARQLYLDKVPPTADMPPSRCGETTVASPSGERR